MMFVLTVLYTTSGKAYDIENEYLFASQLIASEDYSEAITVLRRYVLFGENVDNQLKARFIIGSL